jgi:recombination protein U
MNAGKQFEKDFKASVLDDQFFLRLNDAGGWSKSSDLRFTPSQLCDCLLFTRGMLYLLELKSHTGKSIPESCLKQTDALATVDYADTFPAFVCNFRDYSETYIIYAYFVQQELTVRKSLSLETCRELGTLIPQKKLRVHWRYDLSVL